MDTQNESVTFRGGWKMSFLPILVFLIFCLLYFVVLKSFEMHALATGAFIGLIIGSLLVIPKDYDKYWNAVNVGAMEAVPLAIELIIIGIFSEMIKATDLSSGFVWLANQLDIGSGLFTAFTFLAVCIISTATGSSIGTIFTCFPIFYPAGVLLGSDPTVLAGAIVSGGIFGDNIAPISDLTIISVNTQYYKFKEGVADIGGAVASRIKFAAVAGLGAFILYSLVGGGGTVFYDASETFLNSVSPTSLIMLIPVLVVLFISVKTRNLYKAITIGIFLGTGVALASGLISGNDILSVNDGLPVGFLTDGVGGTMGIITLILSIYAITGVLNAAGAIDRVTNAILNSRLCQTTRGAEIAMMLGVSFTTMAFGGVNSAAIAAFGKVQNKIGQSVNLHPYRRANLLDGFANSLVMVIPFLSVYVYIGTALSAGYDFVAPLTPTQISSGLFYPVLLFVVLLFSVFTGWGRRYEGPNGEPIKTPYQEDVLDYSETDKAKVPISKQANY